MRARAESTTAQGQPDGWTPEPGYYGEVDPSGGTRLVCSVPADRLPAAHLALIGVLRPKLGVLWRQIVDRKTPRPNGAPPKDQVALDVSVERLLAGLRACAGVVYDDARAELWIRGGMGEQIVLDQDGVLYAYPDDPAFRDALDAIGLADRDVEPLSKRDYVKHWYYAEHDVQEVELAQLLGLTTVPHRKG